MTQEEKQLLLKDLCARLPYGVKIQVYYEDIAGSGYFDETVWSIDNDEPFHVNDRWIENIKPYLRPMSSMTEEEKHKLLKFGAVTYLENEEVIDVSCVGFERHADVQDYLNACHFDYRGLIDKGLALEASEGMYKI